MTTHLELELEAIKQRIFEMADFAIESVAKAVESLKNGDLKAAKEIVGNDSRLDRLEVEIDEECIRILVTRQPAAVDLRFVLAMLKINTDLERIGDLASNIACETIRQEGRPPLKPLVDIPRMSEIAVGMIRGAFQSMTGMNAEAARDVIESDREMDALNLQIYRELFSYMAEKPESISQALGLIMAAKALERIGDHATNIAERIVYYIEGVDIRHSEG